jgi:hypothetical protein
MNVSAPRRPATAFLFAAAALTAAFAILSLSSNRTAQADHAGYNPSASEDGAGPNTCNDGIDNPGGDTLIDAQDPDCHGTYDPTASEDGGAAGTCSDGIDNGGGDGADKKDANNCYTGFGVAAADWPSFDATFDTRLCNALPATYATGLPAYYAALNGTGAGCAQDGTASGNPDLGNAFTVPIGSENFAAFATSLAGFTLADHSAIPDGSLVGGLLSSVALGLGNGACTQLGAAIKFAFHKATVSTASIFTVDPEGQEARFDTLADDNEMPIGQSDPDSPAVTQFPDMTLRLFDPDGSGDASGGSSPVLPVARYVGLTQVPTAGDFQILQLLTFAPGALQTAFNVAGYQSHPFAKLPAALGNVTITVLNDPTATTISPNVITDFCTPLGSQSALLGDAYTHAGSEDGAGANTCRDGVDNGGGGGIDYADPDCRVDRITAPAAAGSYYAQTLTQSIRDSDDDGLDNGFDSCQTIDNIDDPFPTFDGTGGDGDSYDPACDPTPGTNTAGVVQCEGEAVPTGHSGDHDGDCYPNAQDPCPAVQNIPPLGTPPGTGEVDSEQDGTWNAAAWDGGTRGDNITDDCDTDDVKSDGGFFQARAVDAVCITSTDADDDGWCVAQDSDDGDPDVSGPSGGGGDHIARSTQTTDPDGDGFSTAVEIQIGTDPLSDCRQVTGHDAWPADLVPSNSINISDVGVVLPPSFGSTPASGGSYSARKDLVPAASAAASAVNISDVGKVLPPTFGMVCSP